MKFYSRDGISGILVKQTYPPAHVPPHQAPCRVHRGRLQRALLKETDQRRIRPGMKLVSVELLPCGKLHLTFDDGFTDNVDLLVGADGIRSVSLCHNLSLTVATINSSSP